MIELLSDPRVLWALGIVVLLPVAIIATAEVEERLRQRDSPLTRVASVMRQWTIPALTVWVLVVGLFEVSADHVAARITATVLLVSVLAVVMMLVGLLISGLTAGSRSGERRRVPQLVLALPRVVAILTFGWILVDGVWGVDLSAALTALGVTSLIVSFALQDTLSGLASGLLLVADAPFGPGDWIKAGEVEGRVVDIKWRSSRIETRSGDVLVVPNAFLAGAVVTNFDQPTRLHRVTVPVQVAFVNPPTSARAMLLDAARSVDHVLADPAPDVRVVQIDDPLMGYEVHMWIDDYAHAPQVSSDLGAAVWYQSHRHGVPLPSPAYDIFHHDPADDVESGPLGTDILGVSPLFDRLDQDELEHLVEGARLLRFQQGEVITGSGRYGSEVYLLVHGSATIAITETAGDPAEVIRLDEGDVFGLLTPSDDWTRQFAIRAVDDCEVLVIPGPAAGAVASRNPELARALNQIEVSRHRRLGRAMARIGRDDASDAPGATA